jgi:hypothetical protein
MFSWWLTADVSSVLGWLYHVDVSNIAKILEVRASSMIRAEDIGKRAQMNTVLTTQN